MTACLCAARTANQFAAELIHHPDTIRADLETLAGRPLTPGEWDEATNRVATWTARTATALIRDGQADLLTRDTIAIVNQPLEEATR